MILPKSLNFQIAVPFIDLIKQERTIISLLEEVAFLKQEVTVELLEETFIHLRSEPLEYEVQGRKRHKFFFDDTYRMTIWFDHRQDCIRSIEVETHYSEHENNWRVIGHISYPKTLDSLIANLNNLGLQIQYKV